MTGDMVRRDLELLERIIGGDIGAQARVPRHGWESGRFSHVFFENNYFIDSVVLDLLSFCRVSLKW